MKANTKKLGTLFHVAFSEKAIGRALLLIMSGSILSQVIVFLSLPIITRLYTPEQFGLLAVYVAIFTMISVVACLRFDIAIPIPKSEEAAVNLAALALMSTLAIAILVLLVLLIVWALDIEFITSIEIWGYAWLLPIGTVFAGLFTTAQFWSIRKQRYYQIGRTRVFQAIVGAATQIVAGLLNIIPIGLLLGHLLMTSVGFLALFHIAWKKEGQLSKAVTKEGLFETFSKYRDFPKFSVIEGLATNGAQQIAIILVASYSIGAEAGFFFLAIRALSAPVSLVTNAVSQVYLQRAPEHLRSGTLRQFTQKILVAIAIGFVVPMAIFGYFSVPIFEFVFGPEWVKAGEMAVILVPAYLFSGFSASIGMVMNVTGQQKAMMYLKLIGFALRIGCVAAAVLFFPSMVIEFFAASSFIYYALCTAFFYRASAHGTGSSTTQGGIQ